MRRGNCVNDVWKKGHRSPQPLSHLRFWARVVGNLGGADLRKTPRDPCHPSSSGGGEGPGGRWQPHRFGEGCGGNATAGGGRLQWMLRGSCADPYTKVLQDKGAPGIGAPRTIRHTVGSHDRQKLSQQGTISLAAKIEVGLVPLSFLARATSGSKFPV